MDFLNITLIIMLETTSLLFFAPLMREVDDGG